MIEVNRTLLSERIRPDVEAAPWVFAAVQKLERDYDALRAENERLRHRCGMYGLELTNSEERRLKAEQERAELRAELAALSAPAAGQDVSALVEALELYSLPLTGDDRVDAAEFGPVAVSREMKRRAALAAHKAGGGQP